MKKCLIIFLLAIFVIPSIAFAQDPPVIVWDKTFDTGDEDWGEDIAVDADGFVYVTGTFWNGVDFDWLTIKYDADGDTVWTRTYDSGLGDDETQAVAVDNFGNVYVVGSTQDNTIRDWRYIMYGSDGTLLWDKTRDWGTDVDQGCHDIVVDTIRGYIFMTGEFIGTDGSYDYLTVKCAIETGNYISENGWSGGVSVNNNGWAITMDPAGYIYVSGTVWSATTDWGTVKYDTNLNLQWDVIHDSGANEYIPASAIAVDNVSGNVYLVGWVENATTDWQIVKYAADSTLLWDKTIDSGANEGAWGVEVDTAGYVYVNGDYDTGTGWDCRTIQCDTNGNVQWHVDYDGGYGDDAGRGIAIDDSRYLYVIGHSYRTADHDYLAIKYEQQTGIAENNPPSMSLPRSWALSQNYPNPFNPSTTIEFDIPGTFNNEEKVNLTVYDIRGRRVRTLIHSDLEPGRHKIQWNGRNDRGESVASGIYLYQLKAGGETYTRKMIVLK
jgi:hypothetical protein